jgi:hypothetical protein
MSALRMLRLACVVGALISGTGCYAYTPAFNAPSSGVEVSVSLTDKGRAALGDRVGPEMDQLRGVLTESTDSSVSLTMRETVSLRGVSAKWADEAVALRREYVSTMRLRTFSRGRSAVVAGTFGAAAAFFVISGGFGDGSRKIESDPSKPPVGPGPSSKVGSLTIPFRSDY